MTPFLEAGFADLPYDSQRLFGLSLFSEVCVSLKEEGASRYLYEMLLPHRELNVVSPPEVSTGSASRYLGLLASAMGAWEEARDHFEDALSKNAEMGAHLWLACTEVDYALMLVRRGAPSDPQKAEGLVESALSSLERLDASRLRRRASAALTEAVPS